VSAVVDVQYSDMRRLSLLGACLPLTLLFLPALFGELRTVAITVDDLPYAGGAFTATDVPKEISQAEKINRNLLAAFKSHRIPVTGFVIQQRVESVPFSSGAKILKEWVRQGFDLGNHTYSHPDINGLSVEQIENEIVRGESTIGPLLKEAGKKIEFFRFPMNHTGDTKEKHDVIAAFLQERQYKLATCTIDTSDYIFNDAYLRILAKADHKAAEKLRLEYLAYTSAEIDYYAALDKQVFGYEPPEVMLLHDNRLNADTIEQVLVLFVQRGYRFVSLGEAQADAAYRTPETYITKWGPMWGYRWAKVHEIKVNGRLEMDPPRWVTEYGKPGSLQKSPGPELETVRNPETGK
jgi:peptidoglycan-N-acetylglucosamine deacetylase